MNKNTPTESKTLNKLNKLKSSLEQIRKIPIMFRSCLMAEGKKEKQIINEIKKIYKTHKCEWIYYRGDNEEPSETYCNICGKREDTNTW